MVEKIDPELMEQFLADFETAIQPEITRIDRRRMEAIAKAPTIIVCNSPDHPSTDKLK